jgi:hypothetical protein
MKLIEIEGYVFNPEGIDTVTESTKDDCFVCFRGGQRLNFRLTPKASQRRSRKLSTIRNN